MSEKRSNKAEDKKTNLYIKSSGLAGHSKTVLNNNQIDQYGLHHEYAS